MSFFHLQQTPAAVLFFYLVFKGIHSENTMFWGVTGEIKAFKIRLFQL